MDNSKNGNVKTISMRVTNKEGQVNEKRERKNFLKLLDDIKTGKVLILISSCYVLLTLPHTIDQFLYVVIPGRFIRFWSFHILSLDSLGKRQGNTDEILSGNCYLLLTCNYSLNFYFYCLINHDIRKKTIALFSRRLK